MICLSRSCTRLLFLAVVVAFTLSAAARAQSTAHDSSQISPQNATAFAALPDSPQPPQASAAQKTGELSGTVLDTNGDVVQGATVRLDQIGGQQGIAQVTSGATGQFAFPNLAPGTYTVTVSGEGMTPFMSKPIALHAQDALIVPHVVLEVSGGTTSVTVMDKAEASVQQEHIAEQQRVLAVFPNFYSSFDWNAPPMLAKQKFGLATRTLIDPVSFLTTAGIAGAEQYQNVFPSFGGGWSGYGKRYGAAYASHASAELLTRAIFPSVFHTDPRYFILGKGPARARAIHAIASTFMTRADDGGRRINFPQILGGLGAGALSNAYFPAQERGVHLVLINGLGDLGGNMMDNLIREFILNHLTTRARH